MLIAKGNFFLEAANLPHMKSGLLFHYEFHHAVTSAFPLSIQFSFIAHASMFCD